VQFKKEDEEKQANGIRVQHLQTAGARIGVDLGIFTTVAKSEKPMTTATLAEKSGAAPDLMGVLIVFELQFM
jgi:hypothetical protein